MNISVTVRLFGPEPPCILLEGYQDDRREDHPGARSYETNRDVKWICRILQQMEARDEEFEGRLSAIGAGAGGIASGLAEGGNVFIPRGFERG
ncbi:MAG: hypothetical protein WAN99_06330 [Methanoculleus sp.]